MDSARWSHVQELFHAALNLSSPEREQFLASSCASDADLRETVARLLESDSTAANILDRGLSEAASRIFDGIYDFPVSREFGPYQLIRPLGHGGMGVVWLAERRDAGNLVAIKFLPHASLSPARRERFAHEIRTLAKLEHPYIARLYDAGTLPDGTPWFVMEYVEGVHITDFRRNPNTLRDILQQFRMVCEAVQYAHGHEIIHRDLKPSNILVGADGKPRLLDFGIAKELHNLDENEERTQSSIRFFSKEYAAPEWVSDGIAGLYTDVYSLGVLLFTMLTGVLPVRKSNGSSEDAGASHAAPKAAPMSTPVAISDIADNSAWSTAEFSKSERRDLDVLCRKAMHPDARQRYATVESLIRDIDHFLKSEPLEARPDSFAYRAGKFYRRHRAAVVATSASFIAIAAIVTLFTFWLARERNTALAQATRAQRIQAFMLDLFQGGDKEAGPAADLRVVSLIDRGVRQAAGLGAEPPVQADLYQTLGLMYQRLGRFDRAESLLHSALERSQSIQDPDKSLIANNLIDFALVESDEGKFKDAERTVVGSIDNIQRLRPKDENLLARAESAQGMILVSEGQSSRALGPLNEALSIQAKEDPPSIDLAETLDILGDAQLYLGDYKQSERLYRRALAIHRQSYGENHPKVAEDLRNIAELQETEGRYGEAEQNEREGLRIVETWYGKDHPAAASQMASLASTLLYEMKDASDTKYSEAKDLLRGALVIQERTYGSESSKVAYVLDSLGAAAQYGLDYKGAETDFQQEEAIYKSIYSASDYRYAIAMANLASTYLKESRYSEAEALFRQAVQINSAALGPDNINTAIAQIKLGRALLREERYGEAEPHTRAGFDALIKQTSPNTDFIQGASKDLASIYCTLHEPQKAAEIQKTVATLRSSMTESSSPK
jgi:serine/threonine-protein kinase